MKKVDLPPIVKSNLCPDGRLPFLVQPVFIPFSAFWLRSSVVSVLISLIADTGSIAPYAINLISLWVAANAGLAQRQSQHTPGTALPPGVCTTPQK